MSTAKRQCSTKGLLALKVTSISALGIFVEEFANGETVGDFGWTDLGVRRHGLWLPFLLLG
jgi:hypothetical protein